MASKVLEKEPPVQVASGREFQAAMAGGLAAEPRGAVINSDELSWQMKTRPPLSSVATALICWWIVHGRGRDRMALGMVNFQETWIDP